MSAIGSFLKGIGTDLGKVGSGAEQVFNVAAPFIPGVVGGLLGQPAGAASQAFVNWVVAAEKRHTTGVVTAGVVTAGVDTRKQEVIDDVKNAEPMIRALLALAGHAPTSDDAFDQFVSAAIDATVQGLNAYAAFNLAFAPVAVVVK